MHEKSHPCLEDFFVGVGNICVNKVKILIVRLFDRFLFYLYLFLKYLMRLLPADPGDKGVSGDYAVPLWQKAAL